MNMTHVNDEYFYVDDVLCRKKDNKTITILFNGGTRVTVKNKEVVNTIKWFKTKSRRSLKTKSQITI